MADEDRYTRITLRIPKDIIPALKAAADQRSHSMNAEIVQRLEASLEPQDIEDIVNLYSTFEPTPELARVNFTIAHEALQRAEETLAAVNNDPDETDLDRALAKYELRRAKLAFHRAEAALKSTRTTTK